MLVVVSRSMSTSFTWAPVMLSPDGSTTCPETVAVSSCAKAEFAASETSSKRKQDFPTTPGETEHRFVFLYRRMPDSGDLFLNKKYFMAAISRQGGEMVAVGWLNGENAAHGWLGFSPRKANSILRPPGSLIAFLEDSTVTKTELICAKT